jgi:hypothetical protein
LGILGVLASLKSLKQEAVQFANRATDLAYPLPETLLTTTKELVAEIKATYPHVEKLKKEAQTLGMELARAKLRRLNKEMGRWGIDIGGYPHIETLLRELDLLVQEVTM